MKRYLATNVLWNWGGTLTHLLVGFVVMRYLVRELGPTVYGLWILIAALTSYFSVLDFGISGSVARNLAFCQSNHDTLGINRIVNTALAILLGVAALTMLAAYGASILFFEIIDVPPEQADAVHAAVILIGVNLALSFPLGVFTGVLWSRGRFDLINKADIPTVILRAALSVWWVQHGGGLLELAIITVGTTLLQCIIKVYFSFQVAPGMRLGAQYCHGETAKSLYGYGVWFFLMCLSRNITPQITPTLVGNRLGAASVTPLRIPMQLTTYANTFLNTGAQVLTPIATAHHAQKDGDQQQVLFLEGGKFALLLTLMFTTLFAFLGTPLITLWLGQEYAYTWTFLMVVALGELLPMSQWASYSIILGMGKHRFMALLSVVENIATVALVWYLVEPLGLLGVCIAVAVPGTLSRGVAQLFYCCSLVKVPVTTYLLGSFLPAILVSIPAALLLALGTWLVPVDAWWKLFVAGSLYGVVLFATAGVGLLGWERCKGLLSRRKGPPVEPGENAGELVASGETAS